MNKYAGAHTIQYISFPINVYNTIEPNVTEMEWQTEERNM